MSNVLVGMCVMLDAVSFVVAGAECHDACGLWHMQHVSYVYHVVCDVCNVVHGMVCNVSCM